MTLQDKLYTLLEEPEKSKYSNALNIFIYSLILISIIALMISTIDEYNERYGYILTLIQHIIMPIFILEYLLRIFASGSLEKYHGFSGKIKYMTSAYAIIDLIVIIPYIFIGLDFNNTFIRSLRFFRIFRLFRMKKQAEFVKIISEILSSKKEEFLVLLLCTLAIILFLSFIVFEAEHKAQPEVFTSIPQTLWWAVATLTTVGYGDMFPISTLGKLVTAIVSILGIAFIAIPGGIFASEFINIYSKRKLQRQSNNKCLQCSSINVVFIDNPEVVINGEIKKFEKLKHCKDCGFHSLS
jgi:voltage-gated potassium channel